MPYAKILCPVDFSEPSRAAMRSAMDLASRFDSAVTLVHVYQIPAFGPPEVPIEPSVIESIISGAEQLLAGWTREAAAMAKVRVDSVNVQGVAWDTIVNLAREGSYDLVVLGTHGRTGLRHALLGSVAEKVVRHAPCPVLVVRPTIERTTQAGPS